MHEVTTRVTLPISVAIPTFGRDEVLIDTISQLLLQSPRAAEILIVDQTPKHEEATMARLTLWHQEGVIRWERLSQPSQPAALNHAIAIADQPLVLMLDDDIRIGPDFLSAHHAAFDEPEIWAVVGQVLQPEENEWVNYKRLEQSGPLADIEFPFYSSQRAFIENGMSGNMCVRREKALALGGFDENFLPPVSYRFDTDFCKRLIRAGGKIRFEPQARINHLRATRGSQVTVAIHYSCYWRTAERPRRRHYTRSVRSCGPLGSVGLHAGH